MSIIANFPEAIPEGSLLLENSNLAEFAPITSYCRYDSFDPQYTIKTKYMATGNGKILMSDDGVIWRDDCILNTDEYNWEYVGISRNYSYNIDSSRIAQELIAFTTSATHCAIYYSTEADNTSQGWSGVYENQHPLLGGSILSVATDYTGNNIIYTSGFGAANGLHGQVEFPMDELEFGDYWATGVIWTGERFVVFGDYATEIMLSNGTDLSSWTIAHMPAESQWSIAYGNGIYAAVSSDNQVAYSYDGINWQVGVPVIAAQWNNTVLPIKFANGVFYIISSNKDVMMYSLDGKHWRAKALNYSPSKPQTTRNNPSSAITNDLFILNFAKNNYPEDTVWTSVFSRDGVNWSNKVSGIVDDNGNDTTIEMRDILRIGDHNVLKTNDHGTIVGSINEVVDDIHSKALVVDDIHSKALLIEGSDILLPSSGLYWGIASGEPLNSDTTVVVSVVYNSDKAVYSTDGVTWHQTTLPSIAGWRNVQFGNGRFVAIAYGSNKAAYSEDGINWTAATLPVSANWVSIGAMRELTDSDVNDGDYFDRFVAVATGSDKTVYSNDGITWTQGTITASYQWQSVAGLVDTGFVAVASNSNGYAACSTDGINWTAIRLPIANISNDWQLVASNDMDHLYIFGSEYVLHSLGTNIKTWIPYKLPVTISPCSFARMGYRRFVLSGTSGSALFSTDCQNWVSSNIDISTDWDVTCAFGKFIGTLYGDNHVVTSVNGLSWTSRSLVTGGASPSDFRTALEFYNKADLDKGVLKTSQIPITLRSAAIVSEKTYGPPYSINPTSAAASDSYIAVLTNNIAQMNCLQLSNMQWSNYDISPTGAVRIACGNNRFVMIQQNSATAYWSLGSAPNVLHEVALGSTAAWSGLEYVNGQFMALSNTKIGTSPDGITWTFTDLPSGLRYNWVSVAYGAGRYVAITSQTMMTSTDGVTWEIVQNLPRSINGGFKIIYALNKFVVLAYSYPLALYSEDGLTWSVSFLPCTGSWADLSYTNSTIVAANTAGTIIYSRNAIDWYVADYKPTFVSKLVHTTQGGIVLLSNNETAKSDDGIHWHTGENYIKDISGTDIHQNIAKAITPDEIGLSDSLVLGSSKTTIEFLYSIHQIVPGDNRVLAISSDGELAYSDDGFLWHICTPNITISAYHYLTYGNGVFVLLDYYTPTNMTIYSSSDGVTWTLRRSNITYTSVTGSSVYPTTRISFVNGQFIFPYAHNNTTGVSTCLCSPDGITWSVNEISFGGAIVKIVYGNGTYVGLSAIGTHVAVSSDLESWVGYSTGMTGCRYLEYNNRVFVVGDATGFCRSIDGKEWTPCTSGHSAILSCAKDKFYTGTYMSNDGVTWRPYSVPLGTNYKWIHFYYKGFYFAYPSTAGFIIAYSKDGVNWQAGGSFIKNPKGEDVTEAVKRALDVPKVKTTTVTIPDGWMNGDLDNDGYLTFMDVRLLSEQLQTGGTGELDDFWRSIYDVNNSGYVDLGDPTELLFMIKSTKQQVGNRTIDVKGVWTKRPDFNPAIYWDWIFSATVPCEGVTPNSSVIVTPKDMSRAQQPGFTSFVSCGEGTITFYVTRPPVAPIECMVEILPDSSQGSIFVNAVDTNFTDWQKKTNGLSILKSYTALLRPADWDEDGSYTYTSSEIYEGTFGFIIPISNVNAIAESKISIDSQGDGYIVLATDGPTPTTTIRVQVIILSRSGGSMISLFPQY